MLINVKMPTTIVGILTFMWGQQAGKTMAVMFYIALPCLSWYNKSLSFPMHCEDTVKVKTQQHICPAIPGSAQGLGVGLLLQMTGALHNVKQDVRYWSKVSVL